MDSRGRYNGDVHLERTGDRLHLKDQGGFNLVLGYKDWHELSEAQVLRNARYRFPDSHSP